MREDLNDAPVKSYQAPAKPRARHELGISAKLCLNPVLTRSLQDKMGHVI